MLICLFTASVFTCVTACFAPAPAATAQAGAALGLEQQPSSHYELAPQRRRRRRIARGSGVDAAEVNRLLKDFGAMAGMMQGMAGMDQMGQMRQMQAMASSGMFNPGAEMPGMGKNRSKPKPMDADKKKKLKKEAEKQKKKNRKR